MKTIGKPRCGLKRAVASVVLLAAMLAGTPVQAENSQPMLYFFTSRGCAPCIQVKHVVQQLQDEGYPVTTVDVGRRPDWAEAFRVTHTPTLALVRSNQVLAWQPRPMRAEELRGWFRAIEYAPQQPAVSRVARSAAPVKSAKRTSSESRSRARPAQTKVSLASTRPGSGKAAAFSSATMHKGTSQPANEIESKALAATVRLQVRDEGGTSWATGTVVHTHQGESLVVTCGHVFRESAGRGDIVAEFGFDGGAPIRVPGQLLDFDSDANDIALVAIENGNHRLQAVDIAPANSIVDRHDLVFSLGCDHGDEPTIRNTAIKNLARYDGSLKYDIFGRPVNGRSGGGLFNSRGQLIGVCNAAAVEVDEGIYSALETVHWQIAQSNLDHLFDRAQQLQSGRTSIASNSTPAKAKPRRKMVPIRRSVPANVAPPAPLASNIRNVSLQQPGGSDKEVIITVRSRSNPQDSRTITISDPTPKLLDYLDGMSADESRTMKLARYRTWPK